MAVGKDHWLVQKGYGGYMGWGEAEAEADYRATGGQGKWDASVTGVSGSGGSSHQGSSFSFDWDKEVQAAYEKLKPYYARMLEMAGGDLDLAKRMVEFSYEQGMREAGDEYETQRRTYALTFPRETEELWTSLNKRGLAGTAGRGLPTGGLAGKEAERLKESQSIRQEAIQRALENRELRLGKEKGFDIEKGERGYEREEQQLSKAHEQESGEMAGAKFGRQFSLWQAEQQKKAMEEQERQAREQREWQERMLKEYGVM